MGEEAAQAEVVEGGRKRTPLTRRRNPSTPDASALRAIVPICSSHRKRQMRISGALRWTIGFLPNGAKIASPGRLFLRLDVNPSDRRSLPSILCCSSATPASNRNRRRIGRIGLCRTAKNLRADSDRRDLPKTRPSASLGPPLPPPELVSEPSHCGEGALPPHRNFQVHVRPVSVLSRVPARIAHKNDLSPSPRHGDVELRPAASCRLTAARPL